jgi:hypothetical protein
MQVLSLYDVFLIRDEETHLAAVNNASNDPALHDILLIVWLVSHWIKAVNVVAAQSYCPLEQSSKGGIDHRDGSFRAVVSAHKVIWTIGPRLSCRNYANAVRSKHIPAAPS